MANFPFPPKAKAAEVTPTENTATPSPTTATESPAPVAASKVKGVKKSGESRKKPAPAMNEDQIKQIIAMVKDHSYARSQKLLALRSFRLIVFL